MARMILKDRAGELRLLWRFLILMVAILVLAFLLRFVPITIHSQLLIHDGLTREEAVQSAKTLFLEDPTWQAVLGAIQGMMWFAVIWFLIRIVEKKTFAWKDLGLDWRRSSLSDIGLGAALAVLLYVVPLGLGKVLGSITSPTAEMLTNPGVGTIILALALHIPLGFGEEAAFRAYLQTRLIKRHGAIWGILITSVVFTLTHMLMRTLSVVEFVAGVLLYAVIGVLYYRSASLYVVGTIHAILNSLLRVFDLSAPPVESAIVFGITLLLTSLFVFRKRRSVAAVPDQPK